MIRVFSEALSFARYKHANQFRKYSGLSYMTHLMAVCSLVMEVTSDETMWSAAILHDVSEDQGVSNEELEDLFGFRIASMVHDLTDPVYDKKLSRYKRKELDRKRWSMAHPDSKTIKLCDLLHNTQDICKHDEDFAKVYLMEKALLLPYLKEGNSMLYSRAVEQLNNQCEKLNLRISMN